MLGAIVLRDIPKKEARIDLSRHPIQGGFRGFRMVPPGLHYVSVEDKGYQVGFWCRVAPKEVVVRVYKPDTGFERDSAETEADYTQLASSGAMDRALKSYDAANFAFWFRLTCYLKDDNFPPAIHPEDEDQTYTSRFDKALKGTHQGKSDHFLAEFQFAFLQWVISLDTPHQNEDALARWRYLLLATYNAGERRIEEAPELFPHLVNTIMAQFSLLPDQWFAAGSFLMSQVNYLIEVMQDTEILEAVEAAEQFGTYLKKRSQS